MPEVTDPALLSRLNRGGGRPGFTPLPPKAPAGFTSTGPGAVAPLQGGPEDPQFTAARAAAEAAARARASTPIEVGGQVAAHRAKAAIDLENERAKATMPQRPSAADTFGTKDSIAALIALRNQVERSAREFDKSQRGAGGDPNGGILARLGEFTPALLSPENSRFDATVSGLAPLAKQAFRTPGEGASSDRDVQLFLDMLPSRFGNDAGNVQKYRQMRAMIDDKIKGKRALLGQRPTNASPPKARPAQQPRVIDFNDLPE